MTETCVVENSYGDAKGENRFGKLLYYLPLFTTVDMKFIYRVQIIEHKQQKEVRKMAHVKGTHFMCPNYKWFVTLFVYTLVAIFYYLTAT